MYSANIPPRCDGLKFLEFRFWTANWEPVAEGFKQGVGPDQHHIIMGFLINVQVQGQHPHQWTPLPDSWLAASMADLTPDLQVRLSWVDSRELPVSAIPLCQLLPCHFLAHLSSAQDELLWSLFVRHPSVRPCVRPSVRPSVNIFKRLLLWNRWANFAQISYGASLGWGNEKLLKWSRSVDQDGRHAHIW